MMHKNTLSFLVAWFLFCLNVKAFNITFRVDMNTVSANYTTPQVNGTFNNWCGACFSMTDADGDNIWEGTTNLNAGSYQYKFTYDNWTGQETLTPGSPCTVTAGSFTNRSLTVTGDAVLPVVCWNSCVSCAETPPPPAYYSVTFSLDMSQQSGFGIPEVNGSFNNWCGNCFQMTDSNNDSIYTATTTLLEGTYEFKFSYNNWLGEEILVAGSPCTQTTDIFTNRLLHLSSDTVLSPVCWGSCYGCGLEPQIYDVTFRVDMSEQSGYSIPEVNGTFNGWCGNCNPMSDANNDSIWELTIPLTEGMMEYKFSFDNWSGQESLDSGSFCTVSSDGFTNRYLNLSSDTVLDLVCFGSCNVCGYTPPPPPVYSITFLLDMSQQSGFTTPEVNGTFNNWCGNCFVMSDSNGDNIWEATTLLTAGSIEYKFSYDNWAGEEQLVEGSFCTVTNNGYTNRYLNVFSDTILPIVCWSSCAMCEPLVEPLDTFSVTFQLDMSGQSNFSLPEVNGSFNDFCGNCQTMIDTVGNGIWSVTVSIPQGNYYYFYSTDSLSNVEGLNDGDICAFPSSDSNYYRLLTVSGDTILPVVCWSSCSQCPAPPALYDVTFQLDMSQQSDFTSVEINGSFNSYCGDCSPMIDSLGNGIWQATLSLQAGNYFFYYSTDSLNQIEDLNSGDACAIALGNQYYRLLSVTSDTILPLVCWSSCVSCEPLVEPVDTFSVTFQLDMSGQSGFSLPEVNGSFNNFCGNCSPMVDSLDNGIWSVTVSIPEGNYYFYYSTDSLSNVEV